MAMGDPKEMWTERLSQTCESSKVTVKDCIDDGQGDAASHTHAVSKSESD